MVSIKNMTMRCGAAGWAILMVAALFRLVLLDVKPPHFDEGVNGLLIDQIASRGYYDYDPSNYHGPIHFYALYFSQALLGRDLWALRLPVVVVSVAAVWLMLLMAEFIGRNTARWAALALAVSPGAVFFGRYSIHESWLLMFLLLTAWGIGALWKRGDSAALWAVGLGVAGMILAKETAVIHIGALLLAIPVLLLFEKVSHSEEAPFARQTWSWRDLAAVAGTSLGLVILFYSGFSMNWAGVSDLLRTLAIWTKTGAEGHGHDKPVYHWLLLMARYEWPAIVGLVAGVLLVTRGSARFQRYIAIAGGGTLLAYSLIPYKTPWCMLALLWPFLLLFGTAGTRLPILAGVLVAVSAGLSVRLNFFRSTADDEPYVYVQTYPAITNLTDPIFDLVRRDPVSRFMRGHVVLESYHPLPWVFGDFPYVGFWSPESPPVDADADFLLVDADMSGEIEKRLRRSYFREEFRLRSGQKKSVLYLDADRFRQVINGRKPEFRPQ